MRVLFASAEIYPLAKTGGLADVCASLPRALAELGADVRLIMPGYPAALRDAVDGTVVTEMPLGNGSGAARLISAKTPDTGMPIWLVDSPTLFERHGTPYQDQSGLDWPDNAHRFAVFCQMAARLAAGALPVDWKPDIVHANDWHTGLLPALLSACPDRPATVFTIHNIAYQGVFPDSVLPLLGIDGRLFSCDGLEFHGRVSFLKGGIRFSDRITTVSPTYAQEILTPEYGCGLDGLLRSRKEDLDGILNGVDYDTWNPSSDRHLSARFDVGDISGKRICKAAIQRELGLHVDPDRPLVMWLSRITDQKMADVVCDALHLLLSRDLQLAFVGAGDAALESRFREAAQHHEGQMAVRIGYEESLAHRLCAGADVLLHPSRFEPCGLVPLYAMRYGTLPVVRGVGGLSDTIIDATDWTVRGGSATGFVFRDAKAVAMVDCLDRALAFYTQDLLWRRLQLRAMTRTFGWDVSARRYLALYGKLALGRRRTMRGTDIVESATPSLAAQQRAIA